jgi:hypothetical protein
LFANVRAKHRFRSDIYGVAQQRLQLHQKSAQVHQRSIGVEIYKQVEITRGARVTACD